MADAVRMIDTIGQDLAGLRKYSYWQDRPVLSYTTRAFAAPAGASAWFKHFFGIDQAPSNALFGGARIKDAEPGAAFNANVAALARAGARFVAYTFEANFDALKQVVNATGRGGNVRYWVAWWTASESRALAFLNAHPEVVAVQWASPSFGGGIVVPGTSSTVKELNVDLSVGRLDFWLPRPPAPKPHPASGIWRGAYSLDASAGRWDNHGTPGQNVVKSTAKVTDYAVVGIDLNTGDHRIRGIDRAEGARLLR